MAAYGTKAEFEDKKIKQFFRNLSKKIKDHKELGKIASPFVFRDIMEHFGKEQGPGGRPWDARKNPYKSKIEKAGYNKILQVSGNLRQRFLLQNFRTSPKALLWFNNAKTKGGFPYAYAHDNDTAPRKKLKRRSFMWISNKSLDRIATAILSHFVRV